MSVPALVASTAASLAAEPAPSPSLPEPIACKSIDDCWLDDANKPARRPAKLRGKNITPCQGQGSEHVPACSDGRCVVRARALKC